METNDNPLVAITMRFQDGCQLGLRMDHPVPQVKAMEALGQFASTVGTELDITLPPKQPVELVVKVIDSFLAHWHPGTSHDIAWAVLNAVVIPEPALVTALNNTVANLDDFLDPNGEFEVSEAGLRSIVRELRAALVAPESH